MVNKLTKEYAEKLGYQYANSKSSSGGFIEAHKDDFTHGYLKAIEETSAKELLDELQILTQ